MIHLGEFHAQQSLGSAASASRLAPSMQEIKGLLLNTRNNPSHFTSVLLECQIKHFESFEFEFNNHT